MGMAERVTPHDGSSVGRTRVCAKRTPAKVCTPFFEKVKTEQSTIASGNKEVMK